MSGIFGIVSNKDCVSDLFYGTDYHSHLGKKTGGLAVLNHTFDREIKDISIFPFRPQLEEFRKRAYAKKGIGVIGDYEPQPIIIDSKFGDFAIAHVGRINNLEELLKEAHQKDMSFSEMSSGGVNPLELLGNIISRGKNYANGIELVQEKVEGSCSLMLLTKEGIYVARDKYGRTPINIGKNEFSTAASFESFVFENLGFDETGLKNIGYDHTHYLGSGEIGIINEKGYEQIKKPNELTQLCTFLLVYFGNPSADYEGIIAELARYNLGASLARQDKAAGLKVDFAAMVPDSGTGSAIGYSNESGILLKRPFIKFTETWQRSFMPSDPIHRKLVGRMKLIPIRKLIQGQRIVFCDDSLVRGTQSQQKFDRLYSLGIKEAHFDLSCPPLIFPCKFLNFSINESVFDLAARRAIREIEGEGFYNLDKYLDESGKPYEEMVERTKRSVGVDGLRYQKLSDMVNAIGLPKQKLCSYCWDGCDPTNCKNK